MYTYQDRHSSPTVLITTLPGFANSDPEIEPGKDIASDDETPGKDSGKWVPKASRKRDHEDQAPAVSVPTSTGSAHQQQGPRVLDQHGAKSGLPSAATSSHALPPSLPGPSTPDCHSHGLKRRRVRSCPALVHLPPPSSPPSQPPHGQPAAETPPCAVAAVIQAWTNARKDLCCLRIVGGRRSPLLRRWLAFDWTTGFRPLIAAVNELSWVLSHYRASPLCPHEARAAILGCDGGSGDDGEEGEEEETLGGCEQDALVRILSAATGLLCMVVQEALAEGTPVQVYARWQALVRGLPFHKIEIEKQTAYLRNLLARHAITIHDEPVPTTASGIRGSFPEEEGGSNRDREGRHGVWGFCLAKAKKKKTKKPAWLNHLHLSLESQVLGVSGTPLLAVLDYQLLKYRFRHVPKAKPAANSETDNGVDNSERWPLLINDDSTQELVKGMPQRQGEEGTEEFREERLDQKAIRRIESAIQAYRKFQTRHARRSNNANVALLCNKVTTAIQNYEQQLKIIFEGHKHGDKNLTGPQMDGDGAPLDDQDGGKYSELKAAEAMVPSPDTAIHVDSEKVMLSIHSYHANGKILDSNTRLDRVATHQNSTDKSSIPPQTEGS
jgi:hypothetical protein